MAGDHLAAFLDRLDPPPADDDMGLGGPFCRTCGHPEAAHGDEVCGVPDGSQTPWPCPCAALAAEVGQR